MSEFEWMDELTDNAREQIGLEKSEELDACVPTITTLFESNAQNATLLSMAYLLSGGDVYAMFMSQFLSGCAMYRELMLKYDIDVETIETKELAERENN